MHANFPDWYRGIHPEAPSELLQNKWKPIELLRRRKDATAMLPDLVRLAFDRPRPADAPAAWFVEAIRKTDPDLSVDDRARELSVLASAAVVKLIESLDEPSADQAAFLVLAVSAMGYGAKPAVPDLVQLAENRIILRQRQRAVAVQLPAVKAAHVVPTVAPQLKNDANGNYLLGKADALNRLLAALGSVSEQSVFSTETLAAATQVMWMEILRLREETNVLWWVFGGLSRKINQPFRELTVSSAAIVSGVELAELIEGLPGPASAPQFLRHVAASAGSITDSVVIRDVLAGLSPSVLEILGQPLSERFSDLLPVHTAARVFRMMEQQPGWEKLAKNQCGLDPQEPIPAGVLAEQVYRESLLRASLLRNP